MEARPEPMSVVVRQEKLLEKLNLDGLAHWSPGNAVAARELVLAYHDVFTLEGSELGCTSAIEHEIHIENGKPFKEWFWHIPPPLLEEVRTSLRDMLEVGGNLSKPITVVQCGGLGLEEGWYSGGIGKHGRVSTFLINGFQVRLLANQDGSRITTIHSLHGG